MNEGAPKPDNEHEVLFTRHSKAGYKTDREALASENPQKPRDPEDQVIPDLPEQGIEMAHQSAEKLFTTLNPKTDSLFFVSSNEARALETAAAYRDVSEERGFTILTPDKTGTDLAEEIGSGDIRAVESLSLHIENNLIGSVFNPDSHLGKINWNAVDAETKQKWAEARKIINSDDKGSWGGNFYHHSAEIKKIFPEIADTEDMYNTAFKKLIRLAQFGIRKASQSGIEGNVKVLAFGHENYMGYGLNKYFGDNEIKNCETISVAMEDGKVIVERRGEKAIVV